MKKFDRKAVMEEFSWNTVTHWTVIREWIADMVRIEPTVMRRVLDREFGYLGAWLSRGRANVSGACGCLVGSTALELVASRNHFKPKVGAGVFKLTTPLPTDRAKTELVAKYGYWIGEELVPTSIYDTPEVVEALCQSPEFVSKMTQSAEDAGVAAAELGEELGQDTAVALIKDEIRKQLRIRQARIRGGKTASRLVKRSKSGKFIKRAA